MNFMSRVFLCLGFALAACVAGGQSSPPPQPAQKPGLPATAAAGSAASAQPVAADLSAIVKQQFGSTFTLPAKFPTPLITADFDGDGVEDAVIVATSSEPFPDSFAFKYKVIDPYDAYFGMGNPNLTASFSTADPQRNHDLLIIFGSGQEAWHAATPKDKFVIINLPFDDIAVGRMLIKKNKPPIFVIKARESQLMDSAVWWDAKKKRWKWEPGNAPS